jgi:hypothetical protein
MDVRFAELTTTQSGQTSAEFVGMEEAQEELQSSREE